MSRLEYEKLGIGINVKDKGLKGDGVTNDAVALNALITSLGSTPTDLYFPEGTIKLGANVTQPANIRFVMANGAVFDGVVGTEILTLNGEIEAGMNKVFGNILVLGRPSINDVYPEQFGAKGDETTNDYTSLNRTFIFSIQAFKPILLSKLYLTDTVINIEKTQSNRNTLYIRGNNKGGIIRKTSGYIFSSTVANTSDIIFDGCRFEGISGQDVIVFNCDYLIRLNTLNCNFAKLKHAFHAPTKYLQSVRSNGCKYTTMYDYSFDVAGAYDTSINNILHEAGVGGFFNHRFEGANPSLYNVRIRDSVIEGITGTNPAINVKDSMKLTIDACYFELNGGGNIVVTANTAYNSSITISNCTDFGSTTFSTYFIKWIGHVRGCLSLNNTASNLTIHDVSGITNGVLTSIKDANGIALLSNDTLGQKIEVIKDYNYTGNTTKHTSIFGGVRKMFSKLTGQVLTASSTTRLEFAFDEDINIDDVLSSQLFYASDYGSPKKVYVMSYQRTNYSGPKVVQVYIRNDEVSDVTLATIAVTAIRVGASITG